MKNNMLLLIAVLFSVSLFSLETGKINDRPISIKPFLHLSENIAICENFAIPGLKMKIVQKSFVYPIFSIIIHDLRLIAGCGDFGKIIDIESGNEIASFEEGEIVYSMVSAGKGMLFAAIQPTGTIVRVTKQKIDTVFTSQSKSVNLLKKIGKSVYVAVGNEIFIYKNNGFEKIAKVNDRNILYFEEKDNDLYVSTEGTGKLIRISLKENTQEVLFSMQGGEILFFIMKQNKIVIAANSILTGQDATEMSFGLLLSVEESLIDTIVKENFPYSSSIKAFEGMIISASVPAKCYYYDFNNYFYLGSSDNDFIMSLFYNDNVVYIGTAKSNSVISLTKTDRAPIFTSSIIDAQKSISPTAFYPKTRKNGKFFVRTGSTYSVDSTWSDFMLIRAQSSESMSEARYSQYRYAFNGLDDTLYNVSIFYKTKNHPPKFKYANLYPERVIPDYANLPEWDGEAVYKRSFYPEIKDNSIFKSKRNIRFIFWNCLDVDQDKITYDLYLSDRTNDFLVKKNFLDNYSVVNLESFAEGNYRAKIIASDSSDNKNALTTVIETEEFYIDRTPCSFLNDKYEKSVLSFTVRDNASMIDEITYSVNGNIFSKVMPEDEVYDSKQEDFEIKIDREKNQSLSIVVRAVDSSGNYSLLSKVIK